MGAIPITAILGRKPRAWQGSVALPRAEAGGYDPLLIRSRSGMVPTERACAMLESGELDLRIAWLTAPVKSLRSMPLFQDRLVCIAAAAHSLTP